MRKMILIVAVLATPALAAQAVSNCEEWNTREFFETATLEQVTACLAAGADVAARTESGETPLHLAAALNTNPAVIKALLATGPGLNARTEDGHTPLHQAASYNSNPAIIEVLLVAGADPMSRDKLGETPLHRAAASTRNNPAVIEPLLATGAALDAQNAAGDTPFHAMRNHEGKAAWDLAHENEHLRGTDAYWRLNDARFNMPGPETELDGSIAAAIWKDPLSSLSKVLALLGGGFSFLLIRKEHALKREMDEIKEVRKDQMNDLLTAVADHAKKRAEKAEDEVRRLRQEMLNQIKSQRHLTWFLIGTFVGIIVFGAVGL